MDSPIVTHAKKVAAEHLYGDVDYYSEKIEEHRRTITLLCAHIESQDGRIADLEIQSKRLIDKLIDKV